jgi:hypothetical protein
LKVEGRLGALSDRLAQAMTGVYLLFDALLALVHSSTCHVKAASFLQDAVHFQAY